MSFKTFASETSD